MSDPTELVITATYCMAFGIFAITASVRKLLEKKLLPTPDLISVAEDTLLDAGSPYQAPRASEPPPLPSGRVPTWFYRPFDLLGAGFVFVLFFSLAIASARASGKSDLVLDPGGLMASIAFQFISAGIVMFFVSNRIRPTEWLGLKWRAWPKVFLIAPATVVFMWVLFGGLQALGFMEWVESLGVETVQDTVKLLQESSDPLVLGLMGFAAVVAAPLCEEIVFRGYLYPVAKKFSGPWVAGICSAMVFAAAHGSLAALLPLFIFGCVLVFIYEKTGSIWAPVAVHFCFNSATVITQMIARHYQLGLDVSP
jgi:membrane protease YdiL (CAAX protease family)